MNLVHAPLARTEPPAPAVAGSTVRVMQIGQHVIAAALTLIGVIRAVGAGTPVWAALAAGAAILGWHAVGTALLRGSRARSPRAAAWWLVAFAAVWAAATAVSPEFVWIAFLLWLLAGHLLPLPWGLLYAGCVLAVVIVAPILHDGAIDYAEVFGPLIGGVFAFGISRGYLHLLREAAERERLVASLRRAQEEMADLQDELALAHREWGAVAERTRISRDIHDTIAQALSSIRLLAHAGAARTADPEAARTLLQVESLAGESLADVRRIVAALAPAELKHDALAVALRRIVERVAEEEGLEAELHVDEGMPALPTQIEVALLRTAQSALANVRTHAAASRAVVSLIEADRLVRLDIIDDGRGFDLGAWERRTALDAELQGSSSYGLRFMRARLRELGGGIEIESAPGEGTAISAYVPIHIETTQERPRARPQSPTAATNPEEAR